MEDKVLHISDIHLGGRYTIGRLDRFIRGTVDLSLIDYLIISGDLVENKNMEKEAIYSSIQSWLTRLTLEYKGLKVYIINGNHDCKDTMRECISGDRIYIIDDGSVITTKNGLNIYVTHSPSLEYVNKYKKLVWDVHYLQGMDYRENYKGLVINDSLDVVCKGIGSDKVLCINGHLHSHLVDRSRKHTKHLPVEVNIGSCSFSVVEKESKTSYINIKNEICEDTLYCNVYSYKSGSNEIAIEEFKG